jgi:REP element-mobilizing transposase RayT
MPSKNRIKQYAPDSFYHIYNRGNNKQVIFRDKDDYVVFLALLKRYLSKKPEKDHYGRPYRNLYDELELLAFCLMPNHFHLFVYQSSETATMQLLQSVGTAFSVYFNKKYKQTGRIFQDIYKASRVDEEEYWLHISRYIHLNPKNWETWEWSSLPYYLGLKNASWVRPNRILEAFNPEEYRQFVADYENHKLMLDELKFTLAHE